MSLDDAQQFSTKRTGRGFSPNDDRRPPVELGEDPGTRHSGRRLVDQVVDGAVIGIDGVNIAPNGRRQEEGREVKGPRLAANSSRRLAAQTSVLTQHEVLPAPSAR